MDDAELTPTPPPADPASGANPAIGSQPLIGEHDALNSHPQPEANSAAADGPLTLPEFQSAGWVTPRLAAATPRPAPTRATWTGLTDEQLLAQCDVDTYRASGPGGQHRNKTSSAVRLRHRASGLVVIAEESRSQHENRHQAIKRLRRAFFLEIRTPIPPELRNEQSVTAIPEYAEVRPTDGKLHISTRNAKFWPVAGIVLDVLEACQARVSDAAACLGISTGNLIDFLQSEEHVWQQANECRKRFGQKPLKLN
ncbi:peptide chain release factor family protein [Tuwongella immobilis]|uniref:Prokaryotic-type class I peptide chain release factors domain-containing protein n=1 Tax=Tuwongella immobilis TaxID=692036 RepID=A0A6C2YT63_9BACT|nr:peptide chain release factor-like protein [Tuwongella immobilis]VIP04594.1 class i peptide chain release factor isoform partial : Uncharacterized protein OS=Zea mays GN=Zm.20490 PE=4 SV=1: RF-1 [Tuwongella immobilis]VTS06549.1 class i peptide chain release factor isoform partial : Uncharacterized protein OS=Zea mays GN=Zm.20490 PE=4 SV=1: RF-1 [Tuwongella immobilis]